MRDRIRRQILQALYRESMSVYKLIDEQDASLPEFFELLQQMENEGLIKVTDGKVSLTDKGIELCESLGLKKIDRFECKCCEGTGYDINEFFKDVLKEYAKIAEERPEAIEKYDQGFISIEGVIRRVEFVYERGDLLKTRIFVVGDEDLFSIASTLTGLPEKVL